jgi:hypothetical protein
VRTQVALKGAHSQFWRLLGLVMDQFEGEPSMQGMTRASCRVCRR